MTFLYLSMYALDALQFHKETYLSLLFKPLWTEVAPHLGGGGGPPPAGGGGGGGASN